jgi:hypothetical protein
MTRTPKQPKTPKLKRTPVTNEPEIIRHYEPDTEACVRALLRLLEIPLSEKPSEGRRRP